MKVRSFRYWDGLCSNCHAPLTPSEKLLRPVPTREEVADYLAYMDDLNAIRLHGLVTNRIAILWLVFFILWSIGVGMGAINPTFSIVVLVFMSFSFVVACGARYRTRCPRCKELFAYRWVFCFRIMSDDMRKCGNCGLRALSQGDLRRARAFYVDKAAHAVGSEDEADAAHSAHDEDPSF